MRLPIILAKHPSAPVGAGPIGPGHSPAAIAASVGISEDLVRESLERAEAVRAGSPLCYAPAASPTS